MNDVPVTDAPVTDVPGTWKRPLRHGDDGPSIGLVLCRRRQRLVAEYALRDLAKPIGVSSYALRLVEALPEELAGRLPTVEELEEGLGGRRTDHEGSDEDGDQK